MDFFMGLIAGAGIGLIVFIICLPAAYNHGQHYACDSVCVEAGHTRGEFTNICVCFDAVSP